MNLVIGIYGYILIPIQLIVGLIDEITPPIFSEKVSQELPDSLIFTLKDSGHQIHMESSEEVSDKIFKFIHKYEKNYNWICICDVSIYRPEYFKTGKEGVPMSLFQLNNTCFNKKRYGTLFLTTIQWFVMMLTNAMVIPLSIAYLFQLDVNETSIFLSNTFLLVGLFSLLQAFFGHRLPIIEGPAGIWWGVIFITYSINTQLGLNRMDIGRGMELGLIIVGFCLLCMSFTQMINKISSLFTPLVNGIFMLIMPLSMSGVLLKGILGIDPVQSYKNITLIISLMVLLFLLILTKFKRVKWIHSFSLLIGLMVGWLVYYLLGFKKSFSMEPLFTHPTFFFWGYPELNWGILSISLVTGILMLSNIAVSIQSMLIVKQSKVSKKIYENTGKVTGLSYMLSGMCGTVGLLPLASSSSVVQLSGISSRLPFILASFIMLSLGFFRGLSNLVSSIPDPVIYIVLFVLFIQLIEIGFKFFNLIEMNNNNLFIISLSLMIGIGAMYIPYTFIQQFHPIVGNIIGNGLLISIIIAISLEQSFKLLKLKHK
ncbi:purine/pyrimidine permease [Alteribacillus sp. JSM 102045]|uniref:purine/pyrimidine permease n=1 Tax=Alteribacillus sp. JSM 102045 TaxID=1562101 RepID=UPI0035C12CCB